MIKAQLQSLVMFAALKEGNVVKLYVMFGADDQKNHVTCANWEGGSSFLTGSSDRDELPRNSRRRRGGGGLGAMAIFDVLQDAGLIRT